MNETFTNVFAFTGLKEVEWAKFSSLCSPLEPGNTTSLPGTFAGCDDVVLRLYVNLLNSFIPCCWTYEALEPTTECSPCGTTPPFAHSRERKVLWIFFAGNCKARLQSDRKLSPLFSSVQLLEAGSWRSSEASYAT